MFKTIIITLTLTIATLLGVSNIANANDCVNNTQDYLKSDKMAAISIIEKTGHITIYVDNYNPVTKGFRNIGEYGWDKTLADEFISLGCVNPVFIPLYAHDGSVKFNADTVNEGLIAFAWRHK